MKNLASSSCLVFFPSIIVRRIIFIIIIQKFFLIIQFIPNFTEFSILFLLVFFFLSFFIQKKTNAFRPTIFSPSSSCRMIMRSFFLDCGICTVYTLACGLAPRVVSLYARRATRKGWTSTTAPGKICTSLVFALSFPMTRHHTTVLEVHVESRMRDFSNVPARYSASPVPNLYVTRRNSSLSRRSVYNFDRLMARLNRLTVSRWGGILDFDLATIGIYNVSFLQHRFHREIIHPTLHSLDRN